MAVTRRDWMRTSAALTAASTARLSPSSEAKNVVISSGNGLRAVSKAMEMLKSGADTLDAVIAGVNILEEDPEVTTVGYGGLPNEDGVVQLDASVMHGPTRRCGAVAAIADVKTPSKVAKLVMEQTGHVMLVGDGATQFAKDYGFEVYPMTGKARTAWLVWKQSLKDPANHSNWGPGVDAPPHGGRASAAPISQIQELKKTFPHASDELLAWAMEVAIRPPTGTINCLALNAKSTLR